MGDLGVETNAGGIRSVAGTRSAGALPGFELLEQLGRGATTVVHRARRVGVDGPDVAVKMLRDPSADATQLAATYRREAALLARVAHPSVTAVYETGEVAGRPYLVLELVDGTTLARTLEDGPLPERQTLQVALDAARALSAVHRVRLVHRDIKPANLMISPSGRVKLIDFDLATWTGEPAFDATVAGTLAYSAPEQSGMFARPVDARADLYALGVVLFECITGQPPFSASDVGELLHLHAVEQPPDVRELRPECSPGLAAVIGKLLAKDPDDRYQTSTGLAADLERLLDDDAGWPFSLDVASASAIATYAEPRLVGRQAELDQLIGRWELAMGGTGGVVLVDAPAGTGKGRLITAVIERVTRRGACALRARCATNDAVPLSALRAAVQHHIECLRGLPQPQREAAEQRMVRAAEGAEPLLVDLSPVLSAMIDTSGHVEDDHERPEQVAAAIAGFLSKLAHLEGGMLLVLQDVQRIDSASERVLQHLCAEIETAPLLVMLTTPDDATIGLPARLVVPPDTRLHLEPLGPPALIELVADELGGADVPTEITEQLAARTGGSPFALLEYVRRLIDAGGLQPSWGTWSLDTALLDSLHLPSDVVDLMVTRLEGLEPSTRHKLAVAAVQGMRFDAGVLAQVTNQDIGDAIADATRHRIVEHVTADAHAFVHDQVRAALLTDLDEAKRAHLHRRTAEALEARGVTGGDEDVGVVYEIARHRMVAGAESTPQKTYHACVAAGQLALTDHAPVEATSFLAGAADAARAGIDLDVPFRKLYATALLRAGNSSSALDQLTAALDREIDPVRRAELYELVALVQLSASDCEQAIVNVRRGLTELGAAIPQRTLPLVASTVIRLIAGLIVHASRRWPRTATGERRHRYEIEVNLQHAGMRAAGYAGDNILIAILLVRGLVPVNRLGPSRHRDIHLAALAFVLTFIGARRLGARAWTSAWRDALRTRDPAHIALIGWTRGVIHMLLDARTDVLADALDTHGRMLNLFDSVPSTAQMIALLTSAGDTQTAEMWVGRARRWLRLGAAPRDAFLVECIASAVEALRGHATQAHHTLQTALGSVPPALSTQQRLYAAWAQLLSLTEQREFGAAFDDLVTQIDDIQMPPGHGQAVPIRYAVAHGRLAQAQAAMQRQTPDAAQCALRLAQARAGIKALPRGRKIPRLHAGRRAFRAWLLHLNGRDRAALRMLHRALRAADSAGEPLLTFDIQHIHARILRSLRHEDRAQQEATFALTLAVQHGWEYRARWIRDEFGIHAAVDRSSQQSGGIADGSTSGPTDVRQRSRLAALQQISVTAASVLDPDELIRVALAVTLRLLSAERVFVFLTHDDAERTVLVPHSGCDVDGNDLRELTNHSSTLVDQVWRSGEAIIVTGSEQGAALGSQSAVIHGLRSILVAPLQLKGRTLGVIYLDSRVARGIFTSDDVELLVAITHQVAAALETARAARLDAEIQVANQQRHLAETLRTSMTDLNSTLDPGEVLDRLLLTMAATLPGDQAVLLRNEPDGEDHLVLVTARDVADWSDPASGAPVTVRRTDVGWDTLAGGDTPVVGSAVPGAAALPLRVSALLGEPRSWLAVPIVLRQEPAGVIVVGSPNADSYADVDVEIAAALAEQGAVAYENAQLFSRVRELAITDELTGVATRRHFWELAEQQRATATRHGRPLAAVMLDIDHFKNVNDTYGHAVGDTVLREVAARLRAQIRDSDILGRVGGEEFALILPEISDAAAAAERLRATVASTAIQTDRGPVDTSISVGVTYLRPDDDLANLLDRADAALYRSKAGGRNQVTIA